MIQRVIQAARLAAPWAWKAFQFTLKLMALAATALWKGIPPTVHRIATDWRDKAVDAGFPSQWDKQLYYFLYGLALLTILAGWILLAYATVFIVNWIL